MKAVIMPPDAPTLMWSTRAIGYTTSAAVADLIDNSISANASRIQIQFVSGDMSHIRSKNTKPEELVRKYLFSKGFRYRKNVRKLPGCPDIVMPKYKTAIFVNGCFWHKHDCPRFVWPSSNQEYWIPKISGNVQRDQMHYRELCENGWHVLVVWECQLNKKQFDSTMELLAQEIYKNRREEEKN